MARHCLQAKAAGPKPILFPANQNLGRFGRHRSTTRFFHALASFDRSPSRCSHRLFEPIFQHFPPPPLPPACELIPSLFLFLVLVGGGSLTPPPPPPPFAEEILVYYILADLEKLIKFVTFGGQIYCNLNRVCVYLLSKQVRRHAELLVTQSFQRRSYRKNALI